MPTDLHKQLAAELGLSPADAERVLNDLLRDLNDRVQSGEDVSLHGLGTFFADEGTLQFTPDALLQKAVNYRNDHLAPLTVGASSPSSPARDEPDATSETPPAIEDVPPSVEEDTPPSVESVEDEATPPATALPSDEPAVDEAPADPADDVAALADDWAEELDASAPAQKQRPPIRRTQKPPPDANASSASRAQVAGLIGSVVLLALLIWFVSDTRGLITGPGGLFAGDSELPADTAIATASATDAASDEASADDTAEDASSSVQPPPPTIDRAAGGWTIVVASRTRPGEAERVLETYQQHFTGDSVAVDILTGSIGDAVRYRVAVGQYPSRAAALSARSQLQDRLPDDAWPLRVQPNS